MSHHPAYARNAPADELSHLRSQNEQLWRIIEKQRVMIQNLQKDNARLAAERDGLADKLQGLSKHRQRTASILISPEMLREIAEADDGSSELSPVPASSPVPPPRSPFRQAKSDEVVPQQRSTRRARVRESMMPPPRGALEHDPMMRAASPPLPRRPPALGSPRLEQQDTMTSPVPTIQEPISNDANPPLSLGNICVSVVASNIKTNERGKEVIAFIISVCRKGSDDQKLEELWRVEKLYSDFLDLDTKLKTQHHHTITSRIAKLPDKALFSTHAPSKVDQRKLALEQYLQHAISLPWDDMSTLCEFLSTNVIDHEVYQATGSKQGYLTKRGKNFGGWKTRYFVLNDDVIDYYESKDGNHLGTIRLTNAQIGRQTSSITPNADDSASVYRHAFLLVEQKRAGSSHVVRHILCADSDKERDEWVEAILQNIRFDDDPPLDAYKLDKNNKRNKKAGKPSTSAVPAPPPPPPPVPAVMEPTDSVGLAISSNTTGPTPSVSSDSTNSSLLSSSLPSTAEGRESMEQYRSRNLQTPPPIMVRRSSMINLSSTTEEEPIPRSVSPGPGRHSEELPDEVSEKKTKNKSNRMTIWGKKVFGSDSSSSSSPPRPSTSLSATTASSDTSSLKTTSSSSGFRSFLSRTSNESTDRPVVNPKQVFGVPLEEAVRISRVVEGYELPSVVYRCIEYLDAKNAVMEEGLYRLSGSAAVIKSLKQKFNKEGDVNLLAAKEEYDVHAVAGLLKMWLRELPTSVLTRERRMDFLHVIDLLDRKDRVNELGRLVSQLPLANYTLLRALTAHLIRVVQHSDINKMTVRNVSIVFSPTLGIPAMVFNLFMTEFEYIFWTTEDGDAAPRMIEEPSIGEGQAQEQDEQRQQQKEEEHQQQQQLQQEQQKQEEEQGQQHQQQPQENKTKLTRKPTLTLREECGRSNRNSVNYIDGAPNAIVQLELNMEGPLVLEEDEDEVDELTLTASNNDEQNQQFTYRQQQQ